MNSSAVEQFLSQMQQRRKAQLSKIQSMTGDNPGKGLNMPAAQTRPGLVGGIIHGITGLLGGNAAQAGLQSGLNSGIGALASLAGIGATGEIYGAQSALANPALFNAGGTGSASLLSFL